MATKQSKLATAFGLGALTPREIEHNGKKVTVYISKLTAGERMQIQTGIRLTPKKREDGQVEVEQESRDLKHFNHGKNWTVHYTVRDQGGERYYPNVKDVEAEDARLVDKLYAASSDVDAEGDEGKGSSATGD